MFGSPEDARHVRIPKLSLFLAIVLEHEGRRVVRLVIRGVQGEIAEKTWNKFQSLCDDFDSRNPEWRILKVLAGWDERSKNVFSVD